MTGNADDIEAIKRLKARYFRTMDTKDWDGYTAVFADDGVFDMTGEGGEVIHGTDKFVPYVRANIEHVTTVHHGHMPEIELTSPTTATGVWSMEDKLWWPEGGPMSHLHGYGHYHETYQKIDGQWRIKTLKLTRLRRDVVMP